MPYFLVGLDLSVDVDYAELLESVYSSFISPSLLLTVQGSAILQGKAFP